uniref:Uncharacterized protein n=1 Tax=Parascaris univalens TaxID=6257 RepID=A0A914ZDZ6_PARUN
MALIYASAVNKRMNTRQASQKGRKKSVEHHITHGQQSCVVLHLRQRSNEDSRAVRTVEEELAGSDSRESTPHRKRSTPQSSMPCSCTPPAGSSNSDSEPKSAAQVKAHKPVKRSRTSCGELTRRTDGNAGRKSSQPLVTTADGSRTSSSKHDTRRPVVGRRVVQEYNDCAASHSHSPTPDLKESRPPLRRDSISLDAEEWRVQMDLAIEEETGVTGDSGKPGAFQRMRRKFSKWKLSRADEKEDR